MITKENGVSSDRLSLEKQTEAVMLTLAACKLDAEQSRVALGSACCVLVMPNTVARSMLYQNISAPAKAILALFGAIGLTAEDEHGALKDLILAVEDKLERVPVSA